MPPAIRSGRCWTTARASVFPVVVGGKLAFLQAGRTTLEGVAGGPYFATPDCSGQAYMQWDPSFIPPPSTIGGPLNTVYVGAIPPPQAHPVIQSFYLAAGAPCAPAGLAPSDYLVTVEAVGTLPAVPPFSLVPSGPALATAVPAANTWALAMLGMLLAGAALIALRRRAASPEASATIGPATP